jgi:hypothetical protein
MPTYRGGCHCGAVRFEVTGAFEDLTVCNCSICAKTGYLHWEVEPSQFTLLSTASGMNNYQFGTRTSKNYFCRTCGVSAFRHSRSAPENVDINVRCLDDVDAEEVMRRLDIYQFDGKNWDAANESD